MNKGVADKVRILRAGRRSSARTERGDACNCHQWLPDTGRRASLPDGRKWMGLRDQLRRQAAGERILLEIEEQRRNLLGRANVRLQQAVAQPRLNGLIALLQIASSASAPRTAEVMDPAWSCSMTENQDRHAFRRFATAGPSPSNCDGSALLDGAARRVGFGLAGVPVCRARATRVNYA